MLRASVQSEEAIAEAGYCHKTYREHRIMKLFGYILNIFSGLYKSVFQ
jgi:hypothetical protein